MVELEIARSPVPDRFDASMDRVPPTKSRVEPPSITIVPLSTPEPDRVNVPELIFTAPALSNVKPDAFVFPRM